MFLTADELERLTGYKQQARQERWLQREGIRYRKNREGLVVTWAWVNGEQPAAQAGPNLAAARG